jgi:hypothetical protein
MAKNTNHTNPNMKTPDRETLLDQENIQSSAQRLNTKAA